MIAKTILFITLCIFAHASNNQNSDHSPFYNQEVIGQIFVQAYTLDENPRKSEIASGSGIAIEYKDKYYFLTNAHVCIAPFYNYIINKPSLKKDFSELFELDLLIRYSKTEESIINTNISSIKFNEHEDICLIEISKRKAYKINDNVLPFKNELSATMYTYNKSFPRMTIKTGLFQFELRNTENQLFTASNQSQPVKKKMSYQGTYLLHAVHGDSGSPVFNNKNEFIGIVHAINNYEKQGLTFVINKETILKLLNDTK